GWRAVLERVEQRAEAHGGVFFRYAQDLEHALLYCPVVDADTSPAELVAVDDQVVLRADRLREIAVQKLRVLRVERPGEGVVRERPPSVELALEQRKGMDPHRVMRRRIDQAELLPQAATELTDRAARDAVFRRDGNHKVAVLRARDAADRGDLFGGEIFQ